MSLWGTMQHLIKSFQSHVGERGCHFYDDHSCTFLNWRKVFEFINKFPKEEKESAFINKLETSLANYNPDTQYLAVQQNDNTVSVELYSQGGVKSKKDNVR